jgi:hypothetical protein
MMVATGMGIALAAVLPVSFAFAAVAPTTVIPTYQPGQTVEVSLMTLPANVTSVDLQIFAGTKPPAPNQTPVAQAGDVSLTQVGTGPSAYWEAQFILPTLSGVSAGSTTEYTAQVVGVNSGSTGPAYTPPQAFDFGKTMQTSPPPQEQFYYLQQPYGQTPEVPLAGLLPLALVVAGGAILYARRRRTV